MQIMHAISGVAVAGGITAGEKLQFYASYQSRFVTAAFLVLLCIFSAGLETLLPGLDAKEVAKKLVSTDEMLRLIFDIATKKQAIDFAELIRNVPVIFLGATSVWWYVQYSDATTRESQILAELYTSTSSQSVEWKDVSGYRYIPLLSFVFLCCFVGCCLSIGTLYRYCIFAFAINVMDFIGNALCQLNIQRFSNSKKFMPSVFNKNYSEIIARRIIARKYWIRRPHLVRVAAGAIVTATVGGLAYGLQQPASSPPMIALYLLMSFAIAANQITMQIWRAPRDAAISALRDADKRRELEKYEQLEREAEARRA